MNFCHESLEGTDGLCDACRLDENIYYVNELVACFNDKFDGEVTKLVKVLNLFTSTLKQLTQNIIGNLGDRRCNVHQNNKLTKKTSREQSEKEHKRQTPKMTDDDSDDMSDITENQLSKLPPYLSREPFPNLENEESFEMEKAEETEKCVEKQGGVLDVKSGMKNNNEVDSDDGKAQGKKAPKKTKWENLKSQNNTKDTMGKSSLDINVTPTNFRGKKRKESSLSSDESVCRKSPRIASHPSGYFQTKPSMTVYVEMPGGNMRAKAYGVVVPPASSLDLASSTSRKLLNRRSHWKKIKEADSSDEKASASEKDNAHTSNRSKLSKSKTRRIKRTKGNNFESNDNNGNIGASDLDDIERSILEGINKSSGKNSRGKKENIVRKHAGG